MPHIAQLGEGGHQIPNDLSGHCIFCMKLVTDGGVFPGLLQAIRFKDRPWTTTYIGASKCGDNFNFMTIDMKLWKIVSNCLSICYNKSQTSLQWCKLKIERSRLLQMKAIIIGQ